ncbi:hypothetical protein Droror1_Dr00004541 [Drosera rotundifolia]
MVERPGKKQGWGSQGKKQVWGPPGKSRDVGQYVGLPIRRTRKVRPGSLSISLADHLSPSLSLTNPHDSPNPHISFPPSKNPPKSSHLRKSPKSQIHRNPRFSRVVYGDDFESARVYVFASNYVKTTKYAQFSWAVVNQVEHKSPVRRKFAASVQYSGK